MNRSTSLLVAAGLIAATGGAASAATLNAVGLALGNNGSTLVTIADLSRPDLATGLAITDGSAPLSLDAITYRPQTDEFFGYGVAAATVYRVDPKSGVTTAVATNPDPIRVSEIGFDFNNAIDAARLVSTAENNQVFFPNNTPPNVQTFTDLFYASGDLNEGRDPSVFANAYTNAVPNASSTLQFVLDSNTDSLAMLANNAGTLATVGELRVGGRPIDFTSSGGFDIFSPREGDNVAFALLTTARGVGLYELGLEADGLGFVEARFLGAPTDAFGVLDKLAVAPVAPIPLPAGAWLMIAGLAGLGFLRRRSA